VATCRGPLVSARWLAERLGDPAIRIVDATVHPGKNDWRVYDGWWDAWGRRANLPIENAPGRNGDLP